MKKLLFSAVLFVTASVQCSLQNKLTSHQAQIKTMKTDAKTGKLLTQAFCGKGCNKGCTSCKSVCSKA